MIGKIAGVIVNARAILIIEFSRWWNGNDEKKIKCWMSMIGKFAGGSNGQCHGNIINWRFTEWHW